MDMLFGSCWFVNLQARLYFIFSVSSHFYFRSDFAQVFSRLVTGYWYYKRFIFLFFFVFLQFKLETMARLSVDDRKERDSSLTAEHNQNNVTGVILYKQQRCFEFLLARILMTCFIVRPFASNFRKFPFAVNWKKITPHESFAHQFPFE